MSGDLFETERERLIYLAGYLEGEGSFITCAPRGLRYPLIQLETTDEDVAIRAASLLGTTAKRMPVRKDRPMHKRIYRVKISYSRARQLMNDLRPFMCSRRQGAIDIALERSRG